MMASQWRKLYVLLLLLQSSVGHTLGEHALTSEEPVGEPILPDITGAFELEFKVRYNALGTPAKFQTLLEYTDTTSLLANTLFFGHDTGNGILSIYLYVGGILTRCRGYSSLPTLGTVHTIKMMLDSSGMASIFMDGVRKDACHLPIGIPGTATRSPNIKRGAYESTAPYNAIAEPLDGSILGLRVVNLASPPSALDRFKLLSYPGQPRAHAFVASFYARFDDMSVSRINQRVFDFGNGGGDNHITCGQQSNTNNFECTIYETAVTSYQVVATASIVEGVMAFWHFGLDASGKMWISKDGARLVTFQTTMGGMPDVFRKDLFFGKSDFISSDDLVGVILGFRLDRGHYLESAL